MAHRGVTFIQEDEAVVYVTAIPEWLDRGKTIREIADGFNVSPQTIHYHLRKLGYTYSRTQGWQRTK